MLESEIQFGTAVSVQYKGVTFANTRVVDKRMKFGSPHYQIDGNDEDWIPLSDLHPPKQGFYTSKPANNDIRLSSETTTGGGGIDEK